MHWGKNKTAISYYQTPKMTAMKKIINDNGEQVELFLTADGDIRWDKHFGKPLDIKCQRRTFI